MARTVAAEFVATAWQPPPEQRRRRALRWTWIAALVIVFCLGLLSLFGGSTDRPGSWPDVPYVRVVNPARSVDQLQARLRRFSDIIAAAGRRAPQTLRPAPLDRDKVDVPIDLDGYLAMIDSFVKGSRAFSPPRAQRLVQEGYPMMVAAVEWLQEQDFSDADSCQHAALVLQYLQQLTDIEGLMVAAPQDAPSGGQVRRFEAAAGVWRSLVDEFCADEASFRQFLQRSTQPAGR